MRGILAALTACVLVFAGVNAAAQQDSAKSFTPEQIKAGGALYKTNCESCHGVRMNGPPWGADLTQFPHDNPRRFVDSVTYGKNAMPPWGDVLSSTDIAALWAYVVAGEPKPQ